METQTLKSRLLEIAEQLPLEASLEDVYAQLALLNDIDMAEDEVRRGETYTHKEVEQMAAKWLR